MFKYFKDCKTCEDVKHTYRKLARQFHPDFGGDAEIFKEMSAEYEKAFEMYKNVHETATGETYEKETDETPDEFADIIEKVLHFDGVNVEIIGSWIWLTGATLIYKEAIKEAGFFWSRSKKAWYYNGSDHKTRRRGRYNMEGLREMWGTTTVKGDRRQALA